MRGAPAETARGASSGAKSCTGMKGPVSALSSPANTASVSRISCAVASRRVHNAAGSMHSFTAAPGPDAGVVQDAVHHAEGDVAILSRMVLDVLAADARFRALRP